MPAPPPVRAWPSKGNGHTSVTRKCSDPNLVPALSSVDRGVTPPAGKTRPDTLRQAAEMSFEGSTEPTCPLLPERNFPGAQVSNTRRLSATSTTAPSSTNPEVLR